MRIEKDRHIWNIIIVSGITLFIIHSVLFVIFGRVNADEGWYLYAGRLVYAGQHPYQDFAFTQTPLLPYLYGIFEKIFSQGIYLGRGITAVFSLAAFLLSISMAGKHGGSAAGGITAMLGATFTYGIYFQSITKTYALTTFFFLLAFFALSSDSKRDLKYILAVAFALLATLTRLSALFFALPVILYAFIASGIRSRVVILALSLAAFSWVAVLAFPNTDAAVWGLVTYHTSQWGSVSATERVLWILFFRIPELLAAYPAYFIVYGTLAILGYRYRASRQKSPPAVAVILAGLCFFAIPNLTTGGFGTEYFVPLIFLSFPLAGIAFSKLLDILGRIPRLAAATTVLSALALGMIRGGYPFLEISGGHPPVEKVRDVASIVSKNTSPSDPLFVMEALWVAVESGRQTMPNLAMAQFSYLETDIPTADRLHLITGSIICQYFTDRVPKMIILTDGDWGILQTAPEYGCIVDSLEKNYRRIASEDDFGQHNSHLDVYLRREEP
jgi:hypothetical protein